MGLINKNRLSDSPSTSSACDDDLDNSPEDLVMWLENSTAPWSTVTDYWPKTFYTRRSLVLDHAIGSYFKKFPALCKPEGYELVSKLQLFYVCVVSVCSYNFCS